MRNNHAATDPPRPLSRARLANAKGVLLVEAAGQGLAAPGATAPSVDAGPSVLDEPVFDVTVDSMGHKPKKNADGSFVVMLGPDAPPKGWKGNYVQTLKGRGWRSEVLVAGRWLRVYPHSTSLLSYSVSREPCAAEPRSQAAPRAMSRGASARVELRGTSPLTGFHHR